MPFFQSASLKEITKPFIDAIPGARQIVQRVRHGKKPPPEFSGWGMTTNRVPPWKNDSQIARDFLKANDALIAAVRDGHFHMTQYADNTDKLGMLRSLMWRHYFVFWTVRHATVSGGESLVECGVSDGLTAYFASHAVNNAKKIYLYDAWEKMLEEDLLESESRHMGDYAYLTLERTKKNLEGVNAEYVKGHIPDVFKTHKTPESIAWLHIDLNASKPTTDSLEEMYRHVASGGAILFDDYAGRGFKDTRSAVDKFFSDKGGLFLPMPTGQGVFFKY
jgi:hypothetical protein